jgi:hypothetical protein
MENLIAPTTLGLIIQAISAIVVAIITYVVGPSVKPPPSKFLKPGETKPRPPSKLIYAIAGGGTAAITFAVIGLLFNVFAPKPSVAITSPTASQPIEVRLANTGSGSFTVSGTSSEVFSAPDLRVYVLVHPADPPAAGWWIQQPATVEQNGQWSALAWIGSKDFPPHVGDKIDILVVATRPEQVTGLEKVSDPKDIKPVAQSAIVKIGIGVTK